mgnify:CR=1 FL=1
MSMFSIFGISGSAVSAQSQRLNVVASNLANADATAGPDGQAYKARQVVFQTVAMDANAGAGAAGVRVDAVTENQTPGRRVHEPGHPFADPQGFVAYPGVDPAAEMVTLMAAMRSYEANLAALNTARMMALRTLDIGRGS